LLCGALTSGPVHARKGDLIAVVFVHGESRQLSLVSETTFLESGKPLSICRRTRTRSIYWLLSYWRTFEGYYTALDQCQGPVRGLMSASFLTKLKEQGHVSPGLSLKRGLGIGDYMAGFVIEWLVAGIFAASTLRALLGRRRLRMESRRLQGLHQEYGAASEEAALTTDVMLYALKESGRVGERELQSFRQVVAGLGIQVPDNGVVTRWLQGVTKVPEERHLRELFLNTSFVLKLKMFRAAFVLTALDGTLATQEKAFLERLGRALGLNQHDIAHACANHFDPEQYDNARWTSAPA
jgi:hypothetical protein